jgi:hypothetical protein
MADTVHQSDDQRSGEDRSLVVQRDAKNTEVVSGQTPDFNSSPRDSAEGNGEISCKTADRTELCGSQRHARADAKMAARAARNGWDVPARLRAKVVERLDGLLDSGDDRTTIAAARAVVEINKQNIEIDMAEDKAARLDAGMATERVETPIKFIRGTDGENV